MSSQQLAEKFRDCFEEGVIEVKKERSMWSLLILMSILTVTLTNMGGADKYFVRVKDPRRDTVTRRILEQPEFESLVKLGRVRDWFICKFTFMLKPLAQANIC